MSSSKFHFVMCLNSFLNFLISYSIKGHHGDFTEVILLPIIEYSNVKYLYLIFSVCILYSVTVILPNLRQIQMSLNAMKKDLAYIVSKQELSAYKHR